MKSLSWEAAPVPLDRPALVLDLERLNYGDTDVADPRFFDWLYRRNPAGQAIVWYAATADPAAPSAGQYALVPLRFAIDGEPKVGGLALNVLTHPDYRRQGIFAALAEKAIAQGIERGFYFTFALPNPNSYSGFVPKTGFSDIGGVPLLLAPLGAGPVLDQAAAPLRLAATMGTRALAAALARVRRFGGRGLAAVETVAADWSGWDALWSVLRRKYPVMVVRDRAFMAWRFGACPTRSYRLHVARDGGEAVGYVVTRTSAIRGFRAGLIVDLLVVPGDRGRDAAKALLEHAIDEFRETRMGILGALMTPRTEEYRYLVRAGFFRCPERFEPQPFRVVLRTHGEEAARRVPASLDGWLLTMGDYDAV